MEGSVPGLSPWIIIGVRLGVYLVCSPYVYVCVKVSPFTRTIVTLDQAPAKGLHLN